VRARRQAALARRQDRPRLDHAGVRGGGEREQRGGQRGDDDPERRHGAESKRVRRRNGRASGTREAYGRRRPKPTRSAATASSSVSSASLWRSSSGRQAREMMPFQLAHRTVAARPAIDRADRPVPDAPLDRVDHPGVLLVDPAGQTGGRRGGRGVVVSQGRREGEQPEERGVVEGEAQVLLGGGGELLDGCAPGHVGPVHVPAVDVEGPIDHGRVQPGLRAERVVDRSDGDAGALADLLDGHVLERRVGEELLGRRGERVDRALPARVEPLGPRRGHPCSVGPRLTVGRLARTARWRYLSRTSCKRSNSRRPDRERHDASAAARRPRRPRHLRRARARRSGRTGRAFDLPGRGGLPGDGRVPPAAPRPPVAAAVHAGRHLRQRGPHRRPARPRRARPDRRPRRDRARPARAGPRRGRRAGGRRGWPC
jgi:hypothetical protein